MKKLIIILTVVLLTVSNTESAKFSGDAFSLGVGARSLALGGATVAGPFDFSSGYWNPAGMNQLQGRMVGAMHAETFGSLLNHDYVAYINAAGKVNSKIKAFGFYLYYLGGGGIKITALNEFDRPYVVREESHGDYLLAASISGKLKSKIDFGLTAKIIYRDIGTESGQGLTVDFGLLYLMHKNVNVALMITDATTGFIRYSGSTFESGSNSESIYPTFKPGILFKTSHKQFTGRFLFSSDVKFENLGEAAQYHAGGVSFDNHYGLEIDYNSMFFGRTGFDVGKFTAGIGLQVKKFNLDFAFLHHDDFDETYRFSGAYRF